MKALVTGATGFVGKAIIDEFIKQKHVVVGTTRGGKKPKFNFDIEIRNYNFEIEPDFGLLLQDIDVICHAASWAAMWGHNQEEYQKFFLPTKRLIDEAKDRGVKRFILTSTIAVNERSTTLLEDNQPGRKYGIWPHLDFLIDLENYLDDVACESFQTISLRLGHFIGAGNNLGLVPVFLPRLKTRIVPWMRGGKGVVPLIGPNDIAKAFFISSTTNLDRHSYKFNVVSKNTPTMYELLSYIHKNHGYPKPVFSVPYWLAYLFAFSCEVFGKATGTTPFLSRALVHLGENWQSDNEFIKKKLGFESVDDWTTHIRGHVEYLEHKGLEFNLKNN